MYSKRFLRKFIPIKNVARNQTRNRSYAPAQMDLDIKAYEDVQNKAPLKETLWDNALPFESIPGPSKLSLIAAYMPGGKYYKKTMIEVFTMAKKEYGNILLFPGIFGKRDIVITYDPADFEKVFRNEGQWPLRRGLDTIEYYRKVERADFYEKASGLVAEQGERWGRFRSTVNPIMMQPKTIKLYIPSVDEVVSDFIQRIRKIRNPATNEVPLNFDEEIQYWAMETIGLVALDTRLGLLNGVNRTKETNIFLRAITDFFALLYELDIKPSMWKLIPTPNYRKIIKAQDTLVEICTKYVEEAMDRIKSGSSKNDGEKSILEKLLQIDKHVAVVMAMDMIIAGVDTTTSSIVGCLFLLARNPDKQNLLREELRKILPRRDSPLTKENMNNLPYLRACIKETLRVCPVTSGNFRTSAQDLILSGYKVPKGVDISMVSMVLQKDDTHFPKALQFIPERWLRDRSGYSNDKCPSAKTANPFIYLPFGFGPRMCIGKRFVELELEVALARIIRNFRVEYDHPDFVFHTNVINYASGDYRFKFVELPE